MGISRDLIRKEAKKLYKEQTKGVLKSKRISFSSFYKQYKALKNKEFETSDSKAKPETDFDFDDLVNMNEINNEDLVTEKAVVETNEEDKE